MRISNTLIFFHRLIQACKMKDPETLKKGALVSAAYDTLLQVW